MSDAYTDLWSEENLAYADTETADEPWEWHPRYLMEHDEDPEPADEDDAYFEDGSYVSDAEAECDHNNEDCECIPPAERTEEDCEHGLSAYLCAGPSHYPPDNPFYYGR